VSSRTASSAAAAAFTISPSIIDPAAPSSRLTARSQAWVTYAAGIAVDEQFTVFGSSGAVVVTALTLVLPVVVNAR